MDYQYAHPHGMDSQQIERLRNKISSYHPITDASMEKILSLISVRVIGKQDIFVAQGTVSRYFCFLDTGYMVSYTNDEDGKIYNKNIFTAGDWVGAMVSSILQAPSHFTLKALTECTILCIPYLKFRDLIFGIDDLKSFYIRYLEKNWVIDKEAREVSLVMHSAQKRYAHLLDMHADIEDYVPLKDIASHLGITPTQLSRIRRNKTLNICKGI